jgi:pimeloyl-ACP methyl ester carboxylesterase
MPCAGSAPTRSSAICRSGCSAPAPGQRQPLLPRQGWGIALVRSSPRGGRPDLAGDLLAEVRTPTLLIVGGVDYPVIELNEQALARLRGPKALEIVPGASHLFPESGALEAVISHAARWFEKYLGGDRRRRAELAADPGRA